MISDKFNKYDWLSLLTELIWVKYFFWNVWSQMMVVSNPVRTAGSCTVLYDQQIHTDRTVPANKPDIILRHNPEKWCRLIEVSVPAEKSTRQTKKQTKG